MHPSRTVSQSDLGRERVWVANATITPRRRGTKKVEKFCFWRVLRVVWHESCTYSSNHSMTEARILEREIKFSLSTHTHN